MMVTITNNSARLFKINLGYVKGTKGELTTRSKSFAPLAKVKVTKEEFEELMKIKLFKGLVEGRHLMRPTVVAHPDNPKQAITEITDQVEPPCFSVFMDADNGGKDDVVEALSDFTKAVLVKVADALNVDSSGMKKAEVVDAIKEQPSALDLATSIKAEADVL
jgi:hypothetical protein